MPIKREDLSIKADPFGISKVVPATRAAPLSASSRGAVLPPPRRPGPALGFGALAKRAPLKTTVAAFQMDSDEDD